MRRIGYLVPEFPGQTHSFFWREVAKLEALGVSPVLMSTRRPAPGLVCHDWTQKAVERTNYLVPPASALAVSAISELSTRIPGVTRCLAAVGRAQGVDIMSRARLVALIFAGLEVAALARKEGFEHVHVHSAADAAHVAMFARLLGGPTYSLTLHGPVDDYGPNQLEKWRHAAFGIVITQRLLQELRVTLGDAVIPLEVAPMGVDVANYVRGKRYEPWDGQSPLRIFSCGRLNPVKGHAELAAAIAQLRSEGVDVRLRIAGEDDAGGSGYRAQLEKTIRDLGLVEAVELLGAISDARVRQELEAAHVFALASHHEPLGVAIMEAMALSLPVVVTSGGGVVELVDDTIDGLLVPPKDATRMAQQIITIARDPERARAMGLNARAKIEKSFDSGLSAAIIARLSAAASGDGRA
jgi:colanic acid/amylovoran biosynthesis glycosyltransferase